MIQSSRLLALAAGALATLAACGPPVVDPVLSLTPRPRTIDNQGQVSTISVTATDKEGKPGSGAVRFTSPAGNLKDGVEVTLGADGTGTVEYTCDIKADPGCTGGTVRVTAAWTTGGVEVTATTNISVAPIVPDAGVTLTASRASLGIGLGQVADIVATYQVDGVPTPNAAVSLASNLGTLQLPDGGVFGSPATTDSAGQVRAVLREVGAAGTATITAQGPLGPPASTTVSIYAPDAGIAVTSDRAILTVGFNERATITVNHTLDGRAVAGRLLQLETSAGQLLSLDGGAFVSPAPTDAAGVVRALLTDTGSPGAALVTARDPDFNKTATTTVTLAMPDAGVFITSAKPRIYVGVGDSTDVTARLVTNGQPAVGRDLAVTTSLGELLLPDGGAFTGTGQTDAQGALALKLVENGTDGTATLRVTDPQSMRTATTSVDILRVGTISYVGMTCGGSPCTLMGLRNSGFQTQAALRFNVKDSRSTPQPVPGVTVTFTLNNAPAGTSVNPSTAVTDAQGNVDAVVTSGDSIGSFTVTASVIAGVSTTSPTVGVRGAKPTSKGFQLSCAKVNLAAYRSTTPPLQISNVCNVILVDRNNNPIGRQTTVQFLAEAGSITSSINTIPYTPPAGLDEGRGTVTFSTNGVFPAVDVPPLPALPGQFPFPRVTEISRTDGSLTRNPRDALVTVIAHTDGEEWFSDDNSNGVRDPGEQFIDQGEPFVDANDNDVRDPGETYIDFDTNGAWTGPNGTWDGTTKIWTKTFLLYTDYTDASQSFFTDTNFNVVTSFSAPKGSFVELYTFMPDRNLNRIESGSTASATHTATKGTVSLNTNLSLDGYGFDVEARQLTNAAGTAACAPSEAICRYHTVFGGWGAGNIGTLRITGAPLTDMTAPAADTVTVSTTVRGAIVPLSINGTIQ